jgi:hypothetical protein
MQPGRFTLRGNMGGTHYGLGALTFVCLAFAYAILKCLPTEDPPGRQLTHQRQLAFLDIPGQSVRVVEVELRPLMIEPGRIRMAICESNQKDFKEA